jgi:K+-transporting ATPase ATPase C chain
MAATLLHWALFALRREYAQEVLEFLFASVRGGRRWLRSHCIGGSNLGPTNKMLSDRVDASVKSLQRMNPNAPVPVDLATTSASGLDPDITPAAAEFQIPRIAHERGMNEEDVRALMQKHTQGRQFGFLGEPRVNVLELNLDLDTSHLMH